MLNQTASLDLMFQALSDPTRRTMVERLSRGPASVSELAGPLAMSLSAVVQHLQILEASGLVRSEKSGRVRTCRIEPAVLQTAEQWITERRLNGDQTNQGRQLLLDPHRQHVYRVRLYSTISEQGQ